jgi:hypothetical protein
LTYRPAGTSFNHPLLEANAYLAHKFFATERLTSDSATDRLVAKVHLGYLMRSISEGTSLSFLADVSRMGSSNRFVSAGE